MQRITRAIIEHSARTLWSVSLVVLALSIGVLGLRVDNSAEVWLPIGDPELALQAEFRERFGEDAFVLAMTGAIETRDADVLTALDRSCGALLELPGVAEVTSPLVRKPGGLELSTQPIGKLLIGEGRLGLVIAPRTDAGALERTAIVTTIEDTLRSRAEILGPWEIAGTDVVTRDLDRGSQASFAALFPVVLALMGCVLWFVLRCWRCVLAIALTATGASASTIGLLALSGRTLNLLLVVVPAILAVIATAYALHFLSRFQQLEPLDSKGAQDRAARAERWAQAASWTAPPSLLTAVTTAAGFGSLGFSKLPPVRDLGIFTAFGVLVVFALTYTLVPALLVRSARVLPRPDEQRIWRGARVAAYTRWLSRRRALIIGSCTLLGVVAVVGVMRLRVESHIMSFFPSGHSLPRSYASIERELFGLTNIEVWLEGPRKEVLSAASFEALDEFLDAARSEALIDGMPVIWPFAGTLEGSALRGTLLASWLPEDSDAPGAQLESAARRFLWSGAGSVALRATLPARTGSSNDVYRLVKRLRTSAAGVELPVGVSLRIVGSAPLLVRGQVLLIETQLVSFGIALIAVTLVLLFAFRSADLIVLSLLPNLLPIALTLGWMGWLGIPLDSATVTVAGIALGLVVDDTIHFLHAWRHARREKDHAAITAVTRTLELVGPPILTTSIAIALGFGAFVFSSFKPTMFFGFLIAVTGLAALVCDLVFLPALLLTRQTPNDEVRVPAVDPARDLPHR